MTNTLKELCIDKNGEITSKCKDSIWVHKFTLPQECQKYFVFEARTPIKLVFPIAYNNGLRRLCLIIDGESIRSYSSKYLKELVEEIASILPKLGELNVYSILYAMYRTIMSYYHEELSRSDQEIEKIIDNVMKGKPVYDPIIRIYNKLSKLHRGVHGLIYSLQKLSRIYSELKELTDEAIMLENMYSTSIDRVTQAFNMYYTLIGEKTNKVVTKLTVISAIFLPLTLITGIYGMNFKYMPELYHPLGYYTTLAVMGIIAVGELLYFKIKKWI
ncbi:Mg2+ transporter protein, CorA family protein [Staphylothermus marinus F1]|uniref:Mg2+ transporter protein, CorA family protein n=1 Tax=Staphylothermus marinus (strain ATCC 43588 / DSM 3639 / JCM 9404 / F1) TaxID=399550 RepID=A3DPX1_STAMF|nr:CorA family divalent cation transporter [Staphylothermus marinus]ABN70681.1 Mg2+ transporter protein, CorA family protein [Staphylothermus marinus F1]